MRTWRNRIYLLAGVPLLAALLLAAASVHYAAPQEVPNSDPNTPAGVPNFGRVSATLFRGGRPKEEGFQALKKSGVEIVVNFLNEPDQIAAERRVVEALGLRYVSIPWTAWNNPTNRQVAEFLEVVRANPEKKIFVHCHRGSDRTGVMVAVYRIAHDNWTPAAAIAEMKAYHYHRFWLPHLKNYIEDFPQQLATSPIFRVQQPHPVAQASTP
jgi:protein tyrosine/serine phosphatase